MTTSPKSFLRFLADHFELLEVLCRYSTHTLGDLEELLARHGKDRLTPQDLVDAGILEQDESRVRFAVTGFLKAFLDRLLRRRSLVDARLIAGAVQDLVILREVLEEGTRTRSFTRVGDLANNIRTVVLELQDSVRSNHEAIHRFAEAYRKAPPPSARERLSRVREIWEHYVQPMQGIFVPDGPLDEASMKLRAALERAEERAPLSVVEDLQWARHDLRRLAVQAFRTYQEVAHEVAPLYEQAKRHAQVAMSASALIACYYRSAQKLGRPPSDEAWDRWFGLMDPWEEGRSVQAFGTGDLAGWLAQAFYRRPNPDPVKVLPTQTAFRVPLTAKVVSHRFAATGGSAPDLLAWIREEFPEAGLRETIRAYHTLLKTTRVQRGGERRVLSLPEAVITSSAVGGSLDGIA